MSDDYVPLVDPFLDPPPRWIERVCCFIPILGWMVAAYLKLRRLTPKEAAINAQIAARTEETASAWGDDPQRRQVAAVVSEAIRDEFGWDNANFLPDDRMDLLWFSVGWLGGEPLFFMGTLEMRLRVKLIDAIRGDYTRMTLGEFVDFVLGLKPQVQNVAAHNGTT